MVNEELSFNFCFLKQSLQNEEKRVDHPLIQEIGEAEEKGWSACPKPTPKSTRPEDKKKTGG